MRTTILAALNSDGKTVSEIASEVGCARSTVRRHLAALLEAGDVRSYKRVRGYAWCLVPSKPKPKPQPVKLERVSYVAIYHPYTREAPAPIVSEATWSEIHAPLVKGGQGRADIMPMDVRPIAAAPMRCSDGTPTTSCRNWPSRSWPRRRPKVTFRMIPPVGPSTSLPTRRTWRGGNRSASRVRRCP